MVLSPSIIDFTKRDWNRSETVFMKDFADFTEISEEREKERQRERGRVGCLRRRRRKKKKKKKENKNVLIFFLKG